MCPIWGSCLSSSLRPPSALLKIIHVDFGHLHGKGFTFALGECKDNDWVEVLDHDHLDQLVDVGSFAYGEIFV
jgi:hypothetical protein